MQELGYYIGNCCRRKDSNYSVVYTDEDIELLSKYLGGLH